jgi:glutamate synthase (NADPH/NADH) large chain
LRELVARHAEETGSPVAAALLADWTASSSRFSEVMPRDYRAVLLAKAQAEEAGLTTDETTAAMMGVLRG